MRGVLLLYVVADYDSYMKLKLQHSYTELMINTLCMCGQGKMEVK